MANWDETTEMTTYRMEDGSLVYGEYGFVTETDFFDDCDEVCRVVRERWTLAEREIMELPERAVELRDQLAAEAAEEASDG